MSYWELNQSLLLDKSPPNLIRSQQIEKCFQPVTFVAMVRNPYVHCEALMRRDRMTAEQAARLVLQCLRHQKRNQEQLQNILLVRYEDLVKSPGKIKKQLLAFLPKLESIKIDQKFRAHNYTQEQQKIMDFNQGKIERIKPHQLKTINSIFVEEETLLHFFNYNLNLGS